MRKRNKKEAWVPDPGQAKAAHVLALMGYEHGARRKNGAVGLAAEQAGVSQNTIITWARKRGFMDLVRAQRAKMIAEHLQALRKQAIEKGDVTAIIYRLKILDAETFDDKIKHIRIKHEQDKELLALKKDQVEAALAALPALVFRESESKQ